MADFRAIPGIDLLRQRAGVRALEERYGSEATVRALRRGADAIRKRIALGEIPDGVAGLIEAAALATLSAQARGSLRPVINATTSLVGVVLAGSGIGSKTITVKDW